MDHHAHPRGARRAARGRLRRSVGAVDRPARDLPAAGHAAPVRQAGALSAANAGAHAATAGAPQEVQERQAEAQRRDDEVLQGERGHPALRLPAAAGAVPGLHLAVQRAQDDRWLEAAATRTRGGPAGVRADPGRGGERPEGQGLRRSARRHLPARQHFLGYPRRDPRVGAHQRRHDVPDDAAEHEARHDAAGTDGSGQPDGAVAEDNGLHRAAVRALGLVLGLRPGHLLGYQQPVDAGAAVFPVPEPSGRW